jgi:hypothetical protein
MKLFTIGDSISQGFMSLAAARTDLSYSTLIASKLGLKPQKDYLYPDWGAGGIPLNIENILRTLNKRYGSNIRGIEWLTVLQTINEVVNEAEEYYERGLGSLNKPFPGNVEYFHNIAIQGFNVADSWLVNQEVCEEGIELERNKKSTDDFLQGPDAPFYRTALKVLNPSLKEEFRTFSQIDWLRHHAKTEGIENLVLWLGANNALGTVIGLKINQTRNDSKQRPHTLSHLRRRRVWKWNLWHPDDFRDEYSEFLKQVHEAMQKNVAQNWKVFVGTIPLVTIAPIAKGVGEATEIKTKDGDYYGTYYKYYTYFPFEEDFARTTGTHLTMQDALHIDSCIRKYNKIIKELINKQNEQYGQSPRYYTVDISKAFEELAFKRNKGQPSYEFPPFFEFVYPKVNTKYYHANVNGELTQGGLVSLDGIHPTTIGHGILAYEFLKKMNEAEVVNDCELDWENIFANDLLYTKPITLMQELYGKEELAKHIIKLIQLFKD